MKAIRDEGLCSGVASNVERECMPVLTISAGLLRSCSVIAEDHIAVVFGGMVRVTLTR